jgi:hypothetical protein
MVFSSLDSLVRGMKWTLIPVLSALTISCGSCDDDKLSPTLCDPTTIEICNNYKDDNCNGILNEGCDEDNDGYCSWGKEITYTSSKTPEICTKTFENCETEPCENLLLDCKDDPNNDKDCPTGYMNPVEDCEKIEYAKCAPCVNPGAVERCDGYDNNCNIKLDESFPESGELCGEGLGENFELDGNGICRAGTYQCYEGELNCINYQGPASKELCNGYSDTCGLEDESPLTDAKECYWTFREDEFGNIIKIELPHSESNPNSTVGIGNCKAGVEICIDGVVGGDDECHGAVLPETEICDCIDNDCDTEIDEGLHTNENLQYAVAVDTSGSMSGIIGNIRSNYSTVSIPPCFSNEIIKVSTIRMGDHTNTIFEPTLKRSRTSVREFRNNFATDIPGAAGPHLEPSANSIVYAACAILEQPPYDTPEICDRIHDVNSLRENHPNNSLQQPVYDLNAIKTMFILSDEKYQWISGNVEIPPLVNQQEAADLALQAGIKVIVFTSARFDNYEINGLNHGYGYFRDAGGEVLDINTVNSAQYMEDSMKIDYCNS